MKDKNGTAKDKAKYALKKGDATALAVLGDPTDGGGDTVVSLCIYENDTLIFDTALPPGGTCGAKPCWKSKGDKGFQYKDKAGTFGGVVKAKLRPGEAGKTQMKIQAKGSNLALPGPIYTEPVTVEVIIDTGMESNCWQTEFSESKKNEAGKYKAKGPSGP